ncbi:hypothetical protein EI94DRAFT_504594 [Lactarius quietus]|nr:hypothetical protein EI94DRAFT_504594 [Lactarius quietus]
MVLTWSLIRSFVVFFLRIIFQLPQRQRSGMHIGLSSHSLALPAFLTLIYLSFFVFIPSPRYPRPYTLLFIRHALIFVTQLFRLDILLYPHVYHLAHLHLSFVLSLSYPTYAGSPRHVLYYHALFTPNYVPHHHPARRVQHLERVSRPFSRSHRVAVPFLSRSCSCGTWHSWVAVSLQARLRAGFTSWLRR